MAIIGRPPSMFCKRGHLKAENGGNGGQVPCRSCMRENCKRYRTKHPERRKLYERTSNLKKNFGISIDQYDALWEKQNGCCAICGRHQSLFTRRFSVDHDHKTNQIRGLLCANCNPGIGNLQDSPELLEKAILYLRGEL